MVYGHCGICPLLIQTKNTPTPTHEVISGSLLGFMCLVIILPDPELTNYTAGITLEHKVNCSQSNDVSHLLEGGHALQTPQGTSQSVPSFLHSPKHISAYPHNTLYCMYHTCSFSEVQRAHNASLRDFSTAPE